MTDESKARKGIVAEARWGAANEDPLHYTQDSRRDDWLKGDVDKHVTLPTWMDCSSFATYCIWRATGGDPALDPSGYHYSYVGNSTSIYNHAKAHGLLVDRSEAKRGDLCVWPGRHVSILTQSPKKKGLAASVVSHGQESGPYKLDVSDELSLGTVYFVRTIPKDYSM